MKRPRQIRTVEEPMSDVILVEDDELVRMAMIHVLEDAGHQVRATARVHEALAWLVAAPPGLVISDVIIPGKVSPALLAQVASKQGVPLVVASGTSMLRARVAAWRVADVLEKPFTGDELVAVVERCARTPSPAAAHPSCAAWLSGATRLSGATTDLSSAFEWTPSLA